MTETDRAALRLQLAAHEGLRLKMYVDTTGHRTIGFGHNLDATPISRRAAEVILEDDIEDAITDVVEAFPWVVNLDPVRQRVLVDMSFNLGIEGLRKFTRTLRLIEGGQYQAAATAMLKSLWASQVGQRARTLAEMMRTGRATGE